MYVCMCMRAVARVSLVELVSESVNLCVYLYRAQLDKISSDLKANNTLMQASATWRTTTTTPKKSLLLRACSARILNRKIKNSGAKTHSSAFSRFKSAVLLFLLFLALVLFLIMIIFSKRCYCRADDEQLRRQDHKSNFTFFFFLFFKQKVAYSFCCCYIFTFFFNRLRVAGLLRATSLPYKRIHISDSVLKSCINYTQTNMYT